MRYSYILVFSKVYEWSYNKGRSDAWNIYWNQDICASAMAHLQNASVLDDC